MKKKLISYFDHLSFSKKLKLSVFFIIGNFAVFLLGLNLVFWSVLSGQIYENNHDKISYTTLDLYDQIGQIEDFSYKLIGSEPIQNDLEAANERENSSDEAIRIKQRLQNEMNTLVLDEKYIKTVFLLDSKGENQVNFISDSQNILEELSVTDIIASLPAEPAKGQWFFSENLNRAVYARKIFGKNRLSLDYLGTAILVVDTSFITNTLNEGEIFTPDGLFILKYRDSYYSNSKKVDNAIHSYIPLLKKSDVSPDQYAVESYDGEKYFIVSNQSADQAFSFYCLIPNKQIMSRITNLELITLASIFLLILFVYQIISHYISALILPINRLAENMKLFQRDKDLKKLQMLGTVSNRTDEIGILYTSFQNMIDEIDQLIRQNYQEKILSQEIEFKALQAQLDPHFLYNTLDSINWLAVSKGETEISKMVSSLAVLFKKKIDNSSAVTTIEEELELVEAYINIQSIRFSGRFSFIPVILIDDKNFQIPKLMIQPLIENAIKYAVEKMTATCLIQLKIYEEKNFLVITVSDNGPGFDSTETHPKSKYGIGLKNISSRLAVRYGTKARMEISSVAYKKTSVSLYIPIDTKKEEPYI